jgi:hypothetical protein
LHFVLWEHCFCLLHSMSLQSIRADDIHYGPRCWKPS